METKSFFKNFRPSFSAIATKAAEQSALQRGVGGWLLPSLRRAGRAGLLLLLLFVATAGNAQTRIIMGDMNRDDKVTIADVTNLVNVLLGKSEMQYITRADFGKPVTGITIDQTSLTLGEGGTATLTATVVPADAGDTGVIWTSSDPSVVTVTSGNGQCELYLESFGSEKLKVINVVKTITGLGLKDAKELVESAPVSLGTYDAATAATYKADLEEAGATVTLIDGGTGGEVTAVALGTAVITATTVDGGYTATCTVTVFNSVVAGHECVDMGNGQLWATTNVGANSPEEYGDFFAWGETVAKTTYDWTNYAWGSSATSLTKYVTESSYGTVDGKTMLEAGDDAATANWGEGWRTPTEDEWNWLRSHCDWQWTNDYDGTGVAGYVVTSLSNSNSIFFPAAGNSEGGAGEYGYSWSSTLHYSNSFAIGMWLHPSDLIRGTGGEYRNAGMTVRPVCTPYQQVAVTGIELSPSSVSLDLGQSFIPILTATILPENASNKNISWTCSDENIVRFVKTGVSQGYLGAEAPGSATITDTTADGGYTATCEVTVSGVPVTSVTLDKESLVLTPGESYTLTATVLPEDASIKTVTWTSSNPDDVYVNNEGKITALALNGFSTITATAAGGQTATCDVTVRYVPVSGITLDKTEMTLAAGQSAVLTASVLPEDATNPTVFWSSSDETVAKVVNGLVTADENCHGGTATITVSSTLDPTAGVTATCEVTVTVPVTGVGMYSGTYNLFVGDTRKLTAWVIPGYATNQNILWSSSDTSVATVASDGLVTAVGIGTSTITATSEDGGFTASVVVNVTYNYVEMGDGLKWATCNVGAVNPWEYGDYFAWGETEPKEDYSWATYKFMLTGKSDWRYITKYQTADGTTDALWYYDGIFTGDGKTELEPEDDAATANWGEGWRMPTAEEWENLKDTNKFVWTWTTDYNGTGVKGYTVTSKAPGYVGNQIFLPAAGYRYDSSLSGAGSYGYYWSRTLYSDRPSGARDFGGSGYDDRYYGQSVRPVRVAE